MNCTYTAQGFLACPNVNVKKVGQEIEGFAVAQQVTFPTNIQGNLLQTCKNCSVVPNSCNSKKECVIKCDCDYCEGTERKTKVGVQTPRSSLVSMKPGTTINWCGDPNKFGGKRCDDLSKLQGCGILQENV